MVATSKPKPIRLLVLSDIHFGNSSSSADFALRDDPPKHVVTSAVPMKDSLLQILSAQPLDGILVSGDLTATGGPTEFKECWEVVAGIASELGIRDECAFPVFGNHDVDWAISRLSEGVVSVRKPDALYRKVASSVGAHLLNLDNMRPGPIPGAGIYERAEFIVYAVNTGFYCCHDQEYPHGRLGEEQLAWLKDVLSRVSAEKRWRILLMHHHPFNYPYPTPVEDITCVEEGADLIEIIGEHGVDLVCHGHRHHPFLFTQMRNGWRHPVTFLCAGSLAVGSRDRRAGEIPNLFHVVHLDSKGPNHAAMGCVETFRYTSSQGWIASEYSDLVPLDAAMRFGSVATSEEKEQMCRRLLQDRMTADPTSAIIEFPSIDDLPHSLQCMPLRKLNEMLQSAMVDFQAYRVLGEYPKSVFLRKVQP